MKNQNVSMLKHAEAAFRWCCSRLSESSRKTDYQDQDDLLTQDARRLGIFLLTRYLLPDVSLPVPQGWADIASLADGISEREWKTLEKDLPPLPEDREPASLPDADSLSEIGFFYERLKDFRAQIRKGKVQVVSAHLKRKRSGTYFTPLSVCRFMTARTLEPFLARAAGAREKVLEAKVIDPAMGTGQFLLAASEQLVNALEPADGEQTRSLRREVLARCIYGVELDRENLVVARYLLSLYADSAEIEFQGILQGDALIDSDKDSHEFGGEGFPEKIFSLKGETFEGFDAIVGNPPYLSAKIETFSKYKHYLTGATQADFYLLFIQKYAARKYLKEGGGLCFIVPDPLLLRANAEAARMRLLESLDLELLIHIKGVFPRTSVANVIFMARCMAEKRENLEVARLEKPSHVRSFRKRGDAYLKKISREIPAQYFQGASRKEFRYLLTREAVQVLDHMDAGKPARPDSGIVIRSVQSLARSKGAIFRGEEIGKDRVKELAGTDRGDGRLPILLGGESVSKYAVRDDGLFIDRKQVKKDMDRYLRRKILLQKSTGRIVAAFDETGIVVPQSVYAILIDDHRIGYPFLLTQLNSRLLSYFMHVMFTGYKMLQPQIEVEDIRQIPIMIPVFEETKEVRHDSLETAKSLFHQYVRTDDPGWILEYVDDGIKVGTHFGSAMIHDLLDYLGSKMIAACSGAVPEALPRERLEWIIDLVIYRIFGLGLEEIETVEDFFERGAENEVPQWKEPVPLSVLTKYSDAPLGRGDEAPMEEPEELYQEGELE
jgi:hypothetical protein